MFKQHGTKVIGAVGTVASIFAAADPTQIAVLLGDRGPFVVTAVLSFLTILRGFSNTKAQ